MRGQRYRPRTLVHDAVCDRRPVGRDRTVISGFLITSLLVREVRTTGRVSVLGFYGRRARRILPAACLVIAVTVVPASRVAGPLVGRSTAIDGRWAAVFAANFRFIAVGTDYFAQGIPPSPLQHFWSLAVEEQFYLVWPRLLLGLAIVGRRLGRPVAVLRVAVVAAIVVSLAWSIHETAIDATTAYSSPFTRAWELAFGALLATVAAEVARTPAAVRAIATWLGLGAIIVAACTFGASTPFPARRRWSPSVAPSCSSPGGSAHPCSAPDGSSRSGRSAGSDGSRSRSTCGTGRCSSSPRTTTRAG